MSVKRGNSCGDDIGLSRHVATSEVLFLTHRLIITRLFGQRAIVQFDSIKRCMVRIKLSQDKVCIVSDSAMQRDLHLQIVFR